MSLFAALEPLLAQVHKPVQYVGGEVNSVAKSFDQAAVRWALLFPDAYEVGQSNQGLAILYELLNGLDWALAERSFTIWPDLAGLMRAGGIAQFTWETHRPLRDFDIVGVSIGSELGYTNLLESLDLAGIPLHAHERGACDPLVIAGGHAAFNPEPVADFLDAVVLGDGEEAVLKISELVRDYPQDTREQRLERLAKARLVYVPAFYTVDYADDGRIAAVTPRPGIPARPAKHTLMELDRWPYPAKPIVPLAETVHERYSVEIFRGCTHGCRFCQAGMITRPVRERNVRTIADMVEQGLASTGLDEVGLLSLSSADHTEIGPIARGLADRYAGTSVSLSLPSTRVDAFNVELAQELSRNGRRTGLTLAPEGATERLRHVINKTVSEDDLIATIRTAFSQGWRQVKLYFMCGLPTETDADVLAIADVAFRVIQAGREASGSRDVHATISIGGFVPKPHTPFQWAAQADAATVDRRIRALLDKVRADRRYGRWIKVRWSAGEPGMVEGLLSRGDRRLGAVIEQVWRSGGHFDGWREHFSYQRWLDALAECGLDLDWYTTRERDRYEILPWDHLDAGLDRDWLWQDWQDALAGVEVDDCRWAGCYDCGVCTSLGAEIQIGPTGLTLVPLASVGGIAVSPVAPVPKAGRRQPAQQPPPVQRLLLRYTKQGTARFASHRDFTRAFERALRRAGIPMALSSGFNPHPRISYLNAAPTGAASLAEYVEIGLSQEMDADDVTERLNAALPHGFQIAAAGPGGTPALEASLWRLDIDVAPEILPAAAEWLLAQESVKVTRETKNGPREFEIRDAVKSLAVVGGHLEAVVAMGSPLVRPDDIVAGMGALLPASAPPVFTRLAQGQLVDGQVVNPL